MNYLSKQHVDIHMYLNNKTRATVMTKISGKHARQWSQGRYWLHVCGCYGGQQWQSEEEKA
jgi:hypothetical protein